MATTDREITSTLVDAAGNAVRASLNTDGPPERLYHFTNSRGLLGILQGRSLWASLATALGDGSEVRHGVTRAHTLLTGDATVADQAFRERVVHYLDPKNVFTGTPIEFHPYVISFCARVDLSVHWLHYGHRGTGCAIGMAVNELVQRPFELAQVIYDIREQDRVIQSIVDATWHQVVQCDLANRENRYLYDVAAHSTATHIRMAAPLLKNPAFASEEEWRLITYIVAQLDRELHPDEVDLPIRFRDVAGRIVPYLESRYPTVPLAELVLGASFPMETSDQALVALLRETVGGRDIPIVRSDISVRP